MSIPNTAPVPVAVSVETAGALLGFGRQSSYEHAKHGHFPTVRLGKRLIVPVAKLEELVGRSLTAEDIAHAEATVGARRAEQAKGTIKT